MPAVSSERSGELRFIFPPPAEQMTPGMSLKQELILEFVTAHPRKLSELSFNSRESLELVKLAIQPQRLISALQNAATRNYCTNCAHLINFGGKEVGGVENVFLAIEETKWGPVTDEKALEFVKGNSIMRPSSDKIYRYSGADADGDVPFLGLRITPDEGLRGLRETRDAVLYAVVPPHLREVMRNQFIQSFKPVLGGVLAERLKQAPLEEAEIVELNPRDLVEEVLLQMGQNLPTWDKDRELPGLSKIAVEFLIPALAKYPGLKQTAKDLDQMNKATQSGIIFLENEDDELVTDRMVGWHPEDLRIRIPKELLAKPASKTR